MRIKLSWTYVCLALIGLINSTQAQLAYRTNGGTLIVTGYSSFPSNPVVVVPGSVYGLPVVGIDTQAFRFTGIASITLPDSVTYIGNYAFEDCLALTNINFGHGLQSIGDYAFDYSALTNLPLPAGLLTIGTSAFQALNINTLVLPDSLQVLGEDALDHCVNLTNVTLGKSMTTIVDETFLACTNLVSIRIPGGITNIGLYSFDGCSNLKGVYFYGNVPLVNTYSFYRSTNAVAYYLPGAKGWSNTLAGIPAQLWNPKPVRGSLTTKSNQFNFAISATNNITFVIRATTNLLNPSWTPLVTNTLSGTPYSFSDPQYPSYRSRFYEIGFP